ncbi:hypothetical protein GCM10028796_36900 [Ramlibacter monticola]|uniref:histidine kinase n=1 Tax=Ramlibacter monticola TaxID=1926872 RepID=A0A937CXW3_9BURK|nr:MASE1 domain-containing protein [Ramlibacter monticola]MBL0394577.1 MASE1 domain-containing protein [Ramlibacter monticola]
MADATEVRRGTFNADPHWETFRIAVLVGLAYYAGARIGLALTFSPMPLSVLWPPNALLLGALVVTPRRRWWAVFAGALPAHLFAELPHGVPTPLVLCWFASNASEALIGALVFRRFADNCELRTLRSAVAFCCAAAVAALLSSFLDAAFVQLVGWGTTDFATLWRIRVSSNLLATLTVVPVLVTWSTAELDVRRHVTPAQLMEIVCLVAGLFATSIVVFDSGVVDSGIPPTLLYLPVPFLVWAALRFGPALSSLAYAIVVFLVIWGAAHGRGPFLLAAVQNDPLPIQLFLSSVAVLLLLLAAAVVERREAERMLRGSEELFSTAFRQGPDAIAITRARDGGIVEANKRWLELLGYPSNAQSLATLGEHLSPASRDRVRSLKSEPGSAQETEVVLTDRQGGVHVALLVIAPVQLMGETCHITILRDITRQRQAEKDAYDQRRQLTHLTRVASLSDFSSTIAHELNQPLTAILSNAQAALRLFAHEPLNVAEIRAILVEIAESDKRAGLLIHHLRLLMKKGDEEFVQVDLNQLVRDVLDFVRSEFLVRTVELKTSYAPDLPQVRGDRVQLQQLLLNLVCNACEAMDAQTHGKVMEVSTSHEADGTVQVTVSDTGPGIPADRMDRVFEPFFTTKQSGLGMGLAICRRIATAHGGSLTVLSRPGEGATFQLALPQVLPGRRLEATAHFPADTTSTATAS